MPYFQQAVDLEAALAAVERGRWAEARVHLEVAAKSRPADARVPAALAVAYAGLEMKAEAAAAARKADTPNAGPVTRHLLALYYARAGNRKRAAELEGDYARSKEADPAAGARAAMLSAEVGAWPAAIEFGRAALERGLRADLLLPMLARAYEATGKTAEALEMQRRLAAASPNSEEAQAGYGIALLRAGKFREAVEQLEKARVDFDKSPQIELALGSGYYAQRRFADAGARFFRVIELDPAIHQPYIFLARMLDQLPDRTAEFLTRAKAWHETSKHVFAPYAYAKALLASGEREAAGPLLAESVARDAMVWEFHFELGQWRESRREWDTAAKSFEAAVACDKDRPEPHYRLARVYDRLGRAAEAKRERETHARLMAAQQAKSKEGMQ
ncbi:MAG: tetratricopeptide repeat protein [Bryobacterales bacterium]|nr:tetratricopeptide repeat protein [Bryobacterales bacterium]